MTKRKVLIKILVIIMPIIFLIVFMTVALMYPRKMPIIFTYFKTKNMPANKKENDKDDKVQSDEKKQEVKDNDSSEKDATKEEVQSKTGWEAVAKTIEEVADTTAKEKEKEEQARKEDEQATEETQEDYYTNPESPEQPISSVSWGWPSESQYITTYYGYDDWHGGYHNGIDIALSGCGSPIFAIESGTVLETNSGCADISSGYGDYCGAGFGNYVWIEHPQNVYALYSQLSSQIIVSPGQSVSKGQVIGFMGSSGSSSACHLHFATFHDGTLYNGGTSFDPLTLY